MFAYHEWIPVTVISLFFMDNNMNQVQRSTSKTMNISLQEARNEKPALNL